MNHVNMEEVEAQPDAVIGKFLVKSFTAIVLFDTGASHSYISMGFVDKYRLPTKVLWTPMLVSSPGAEHMASQGCFQMPLTIGRHVFPFDLIILESHGLDVILGMDWLSMYEETLIAPVSRFYPPPKKEEGLGMYPGICRRGLK